MPSEAKGVLVYSNMTGSVVYCETVNNTLLEQERLLNCTFSSFSLQ